MQTGERNVVVAMELLSWKNAGSLMNSTGVSVDSAQWLPLILNGLKR